MSVAMIIAVAALALDTSDLSAMKAESRASAQAPRSDAKRASLMERYQAMRERWQRLRERWQRGLHTEADALHRCPESLLRAHAHANAVAMAMQHRRHGVHTPMMPGVNMREYFQSHWNVGTPEGADCQRVRRIGPRGDGGKLLCLDAIPPPGTPCSVISVGVGGAPNEPPDFRWEVDLHRQFPNCTIDVYDGTNFGRGAIRNAPPFIHFHPVNFDERTWMKHHGQVIDIFKIDCEGCEFTAVPSFVEHLCPEQFMIEVHAGLPSLHARADKLMSTLNRTHGIFYKEPNIQHSDGTCLEFAWRRREDVPQSSACAAAVRRRRSGRGESLRSWETGWM